MSPLLQPRTPQLPGNPLQCGHHATVSVPHHLILQHQCLRRHLAPRQLRHRNVAAQLSAPDSTLDALSQLSRVLLPPMLSGAAVYKGYRRSLNFLARRAAEDEICRVFGVADREELQVRVLCRHSTNRRICVVHAHMGVVCRMFGVWKLSVLLGQKLSVLLGGSVPYRPLCVPRPPGTCRCAALLASLHPGLPGRAGAF